MSATCPWCSAPRDKGPSCSKCGANFAKAAAYVDMYGTWVKARRDFDAISLGSQDGMNADPLVLVEEHGWKLASMANRYFLPGDGLPAYLYWHLYIYP